MKKISLLSYLFVVLIQFSSCQQGKQEGFIDPYNNMMLIEGGEFIMGNVAGLGTEMEKPAHKVRLSSFFINKFEVTVKEFAQFVKETGYLSDAERKDSSLAFYNHKWTKVKGVNWRYDATGSLRKEQDNNHPVVHVSWNDANAYCQWLSKKTGREYRLPTEAEWEFAARNRGKDILYSWGNEKPNGKKGGNIADSSLIAFAPEYPSWKNYNDGYIFTAAVGSFEPNELELYDMTGNAWEWCYDWFDPSYYHSSPVDNPTGPDNGKVKTFRGGCWFSDENYSRIAFHNFGNPPDQSYGDFGFRLAMSPE